MATPFQKSWTFLKAISHEDALHWAKTSQQQHEAGTEEWAAKQNHIDMLHNYDPGKLFNTAFMTKKYGPAPEEYSDVTVDGKPNMAMDRNPYFQSVD